MATITVEFDENALRAALDIVSNRVGQLESELGYPTLESNPLYRAERAMDSALLWFEQSKEDAL